MPKYHVRLAAMCILEEDVVADSIEDANWKLFKKYMNKLNEVGIESGDCDYDETHLVKEGEECCD